MTDDLPVREGYYHNCYPINDRENANQINCEIGDLKRGMYMIKLMNSSGQWKSQKLVVE